MFTKIFFKEWRDNLVIFSIAVLFMLALIVLKLSDLKELTLYVFGMFLLLFLPFSGLLIGSGGFYSEFKDNAWIYLFSRPIKKEKLWIFKYLSLLSILAAIFLIFFLVKQFLPGLNEIMKEFKVPGELKGLFSFYTYLVLPILVFTISFSLSILYEKQFAIFSISVLIGAGLAFLLQQYYIFLWTTYLYDGELKGFQILIAFSFILSSILTFRKSDFSQAGRKIFNFAKYIMLFLALSFALATAWIAKGDLFTGKKEIEPYYSREYKGDVYLGTYIKGFILRYNSRSGKVEKVGGKAKSIDPRFSICGEKIAFFIDIKNRGRWYDNLWVMNTDGSNQKALIESQKPMSRFYNLRFWGNCLLSPDGSKVAFITVPYTRNIVGTFPSLWWMNTDGTGLNSQALDFSRFTDFNLLAWPESTNSLIFGIKEKSSDYKIVKVDLEKNVQQTLVESVLLGPYLVRVSPDNNSLAVRFRDKLEDKEIFTVLDLRTLAKRVIYKADSLKLGDIRWSRKGDKVAFSMKNEILVYSLKEDKIIKTIPWSYRFGSHYDWLLNDEKFVLDDVLNQENYLRVFRKDFSEEKEIKIPDSIETPGYLWGLGNRALIYDGGKPSLWRVDLNTQKWKKVY